MKFMKLGSRPDTFYNTETVRSVSSEVSSDLIIQVKGSRYLLHKYPLLSKSLLLQKLCSEIPKTPSNLHIVQLPDFPGGPDSFELCAKFCYGITITVSAYNFVPARCAAEYLQMTEKVEPGNLIHKLETFFVCCILNGWRDSIAVLRATRAHPTWSEDLGIAARCIDSIASRAGPGRARWAEDLSELEPDLYLRTMSAVKSSGRAAVGDALQVYTARWLDRAGPGRAALEAVVGLLPDERGSVPCGFLSRLLKESSTLGLSCSSRNELARRVGLQLDEASVDDVLVPCFSGGVENGHDVDIVMAILEGFMSRGLGSRPTSPRGHRRSRSADSNFREGGRLSYASQHGSLVRVGRLVDGYLREIAKDEGLSLSKFVSVAEAVPEWARLEHDDLYMAIDTYLKVHPELDKTERKRLCRILDCKKLSIETCLHAAQNEKLPLRVVVQVLFFEHARATNNLELAGGIKALIEGDNVPSNLAASFGKNTKVPPDNDQWRSPKSNVSTLKMRLAEDDDSDDDFPDGFEKYSKMRSFCMIPKRPKRIFSKLWSRSLR
ncbi:phototropic-responsive NPH3 family protein [Striga asiatica]|uniref:Phototropic-responsive NPH3 family protein n=1 Tax=Striga asiatica TaxID=4170 RepID=A0A5A7RFQ4_STRAF|nr:phototropic-responsive NPH3 family protein [Striga asiatica]